jgi:hypothetical protein
LTEAPHQAPLLSRAFCRNTSTRTALAIPDLLHQRHWFKFPCLSVVFADRPHPFFDGQNPIAGVFFVHHAKDLLGYFQLPYDELLAVEHLFVSSSCR